MRASTTLVSHMARTRFRYIKTLAVGTCALFRAACSSSLASQSIGLSFTQSCLAFDQS
jgi:hypothetical protein